MECEIYQKILDIFFDSGLFEPLEYFPLAEKTVSFTKRSGSVHCFIIKNHDLKVFIHITHYTNDIGIHLEWRKDFELRNRIENAKQYPYRWSRKITFEEVMNLSSDEVFDCLLYNVDIFNQV